MSALELTDIAAWALIAGGTAYAALVSQGVGIAAVTAAFVALVTKVVLLKLS